MKKYLAIHKDEYIIGDNLSDFYQKLSDKNIDVTTCDTYELSPITIEHKTVTYKSKV